MGSQMKIRAFIWTKKAFVAVVLLAGWMGVAGAVWAGLQSWEIGDDGLSWSQYAESSPGIDFQTSDGAIQPRELDPQINLALGLEWQEGQPADFSAQGEARVWDSAVQKGNDLILVDGNPLTSTEVRFNIEGNNYTGQTFFFDFGEIFVIDRIVFYPRQTGQDEEGNPLQDNYLRGYELYASDGQSFRESGQPQYTLLTKASRNSRSIVDVRFTPQPVRFIKLRSSVPYGFEIAEVEFYGRGFSTEATYLSKAIDLGQKANFGQVQWEYSKWEKKDGQLQLAPDAKGSITVEGKTGADNTPLRYFAKGDTVEVTKEDYLKLSLIKRGSIKEDMDNWSLWYYLASGQPFPATAPQRFFQFRLTLSGNKENRMQMGRASSLSVEYSTPLLAKKVLGEIALEDQTKSQGRFVTVQVGKPAAFSYDVKAEFSSPTQLGFDALRINVPSQVVFKQLEMGEPLTIVDPNNYEESDSCLTVYFPSNPVTMSQNRPLRVTFETAILGYETDFRGSVFNTNSQDLPQIVEPGDASTAVGTDALTVLLFQQSTGGILTDFDILPRLFTPNNDGANDNVVISYTIAQLIGEAEVKLNIYNLGGEQIRSFPRKERTKGCYSENWDGKTEDGDLVSPGFYICRISVKTDTEIFAQSKMVAVAY